MTASVKSFFNKFFGESGWVKENVPAAPYFVAAGNPVAANAPSYDDERPKALNMFAGENTGFIVVGTSMVPKGILNDDAIACEKIDEDERMDISAHKFVVVKVDKEWYKENRQLATFDYKLRYVLGYVPVNSDFDTFYKDISKKEDSVLVPSNKRELKRKYEEAVKYYGAETPLILSLTFKEGITHYSVHPVRLVEYEVVELGRLQSDGSWIKTELPAA
ncbi:MAG: hypothetical protein K2J78_11820 [Muribaculaceae bacterium]|nr:hypothetical protein [Muribaculaceae bacterium]MDE6770400.1 hypothetical protein [Muribaculaceae bacterium]